MQARLDFRAQLQDTSVDVQPLPCDPVARGERKISVREQRELELAISMLDYEMRQQLPEVPACQ